MESFLPSEIARLVYGYLEEEECSKAAQAFLESSEHLKECLDVSKKGKKFNTRIYGLSLVDILDLLTEAISFVKENKNKITNGSKKEYRLLNILQVESFVSSNIPESLDDKYTSNEEPTQCLKKTVILEPKQAKKDGRFTSRDDSAKNNLEGLGCRISDALSSQKQNLDVNIKEEVIEDRNYIMDEGFTDGYSNAQTIEPEVEILTPCSLTEVNNHLTTHETPTVNVLTNPMMPGRQSEIICPQYNMVQMMPTGYAPSMNANISTVYFPGTGMPQPPVVSVQALPPLLAANPPQQNYIPLPSHSQTSKPITYQTSVITSTSRPVLQKSKINPNLQRTGTSKLRPIAPKLVHSSDNGYGYQQFQSNEIPLIEINSVILKKSARFRTQPYFGVL